MAEKRITGHFDDAWLQVDKTGVVRGRYELTSAFLVFFFIDV